jgi:hypothetical protein
MQQRQGRLLQNKNTAAMMNASAMQVQPHTAGSQAPQAGHSAQLGNSEAGTGVAPQSRIL